MKIKNHKATISEYYDIQLVQDELYAKSRNGQIFTNLMEVISSPENIKLAYRAIKKNGGSKTSGTDKKNIKFFAQMGEEDYIKYVQNQLSS